MKHLWHLQQPPAIQNQQHSVRKSTPKQQHDATALFAQPVKSRKPFNAHPSARRFRVIESDTEAVGLSWQKTLTACFKTANTVLETLLSLPCSRATCGLDDTNGLQSQYCLSQPLGMQTLREEHLTCWDFRCGPLWCRDSWHDGMIRATTDQR